MFAMSLPTILKMLPYIAIIGLIAVIMWQRSTIHSLELENVTIKVNEITTSAAIDLQNEGISKFEHTGTVVDSSIKNLTNTLDKSTEVDVSVIKDKLKVDNSETNQYNLVKELLVRYSDE